MTIKTGQDSKVNGGQHHVRARNFGTGALEITANGEVTGGSLTAIYSYKSVAGTHQITIGATGEIMAGSSDVAIRSRGTGATLDNAGLVAGLVDLTDNADLFRNNTGGLWKTAGLTNLFGNGTDRFENEGTVFAAKDVGAGETTQFLGLETFENKVGGMLDLSDGAAGDRVEISGDFLANGGTVKLDTVLDGDGSATDVLAIAGSVSGTGTGILINPVGGAGAQTVNGIEVVEVAGTSAAGTFFLANPTPRKSAHLSMICRSAIAPTSRIRTGICVSDRGDWWQCGPVQIAARRVALVFRRVQSSLDDRLGERANGANTGVSSHLTGYAGEDESRRRRHRRRGLLDLQPAHASGTWARVWGDWVDIKPDSSTAGSSWQAANWGVQAGWICHWGKTRAGQWILGLNGRFAEVGADTRNSAGTGRIESSGYGVGGTLTWYGEAGAISTARRRRTGFRPTHRHPIPVCCWTAKTSVIRGLSGEIGQRIGRIDGKPDGSAAGSNRLGPSGGRQFTDGLGNLVDLDGAESLIGRAGLAFEYQLTGESRSERQGLCHRQSPAGFFR